MDPIAEHALEFEAMVARAARWGWLDLAGLAETYVGLAPAAHLHLADPRKVDIAAVVEVLCQLPAPTWAAPSLRFVADLSVFPHEGIAASAAGHAGLLGDGTLLVEAPLGLATIAHWAAALCLLQHEVHKAAALAPPDILSADGGTTELDLSDQLTELAFAWGTDVTTLCDGDAATGGTLLPLLLRQLPFPKVQIHADLQPKAAAHRQRELGAQVVATLAELGLAARCMHIWVGSGVVVECLSPYPRELRQVLRRWAELQPDRLGDDLRHPPAVLGEDVLYAIAHDFLTANPDLDAERTAADRTVGLQRHHIGPLTFESVDLGRIDPTVCDSRITAWEGEGAAPVLLRLPLTAGAHDAALLRAVLDAFGGQTESLTLMLEGTAAGGTPATLVVPDLMVRWAGEQKVWLPTANGLDATVLAGYLDQPAQRGPVLSLPSAALVAHHQLERLRQTLHVCAVEVGGAGLLGAVVDALWSGSLASSSRVAWAVADVARINTGRPSVASLTALSAVAIAQLRALGASAPVAKAQPEPAASPQHDPPRQPMPSSRAIRIKA